jgi:hypothetical protein
MSRDWRISSFNGALLAAYFIPTWTILVFKIMISPIRGLYERPNISVALFISDHLQLAAMTTIRLAWLLALAKLTVVGFFAIFVVLITRPSLRKAGGCDGIACRRDRSASAACDGTVDAARHRDRAAGRTSGSAAARSSRS